MAGHHHDHEHDHGQPGERAHLHADHAAAECEGPSGGLERRLKERRGLSFALAVTSGIFLLELVGGWISGSLALQADAGHLFADVVGLGISLASIAIASRPVDSRRTFGYYRLEILSALANGVLLGVAAVLILKEAAGRAFHPEAIATGKMIALAAIGLAANLASIVPLARLRGSITVRGAFAHALGDAVNAVGVIVAGLVIAATGWLWADTLVSVLIAGTIVWSAWGLVKEAVGVLLEGIPMGIELAAVRKSIGEIAGVKDVHDMHIWTITSGMFAFSCHVSVASGLDDGQRDKLLTAAKTLLHDRYGIDHSTIQVEAETWDEIGLVH
jgi:cobalt-zinc-cadmium efflux system protein